MRPLSVRDGCEHGSRMRPSSLPPHHTSQPKNRLEPYLLFYALISHIAPLSPTKLPGLEERYAFQDHKKHITPLCEFRVGLRTLSGHLHNHTYVPAAKQPHIDACCVRYDEGYGARTRVMSLWRTLPVKKRPSRPLKGRCRCGSLAKLEHWL